MFELNEPNERLSVPNESDFCEMNALIDDRITV